MNTEVINCCDTIERIHKWFPEAGEFSETNKN